MTLIAIVDNDADLIDLLQDVFRERGWDSLPCSCASSVLSRISAGLPDLILLDVWLGTPTTGWELLRVLKQESATRDIPVVVCSGAIDHLADKRRWLEQRGIGVLVKPFDIDDVYLVVERALAARIHGLSG